MEYNQPNTFGGTNDVVSIWTNGYFGGTAPSTVNLLTLADLLLDPAYMPKSPGAVTGQLFGYGYPLLTQPVSGTTCMWAARINLAF